MFIDVQFDSLNSPRDLAPGTYDVLCRKYRDPGSGNAALLFEYRAAGADTLRAVDLLIAESDGTLRARDFVKMPDLDWRDSAGYKAKSLALLLPPELSRYMFAEEESLNQEQVRA